MVHEFPSSLWEAVLDQAQFSFGSARLHHCGMDWSIAARVIPDEMLHISFSGRIRWRLGSESFTSRPGELVFIPPGVPWWAECATEEPLQLAVVHFEARFPSGQRYLGALNVPHLIHPEAEDGFDSLMRGMLEADASTAAGINLRRRALLMELMWRLFPYHADEQPVVRKATADDANAELVWKIIRHLQEHLAAPVTRNELARRYHVAESTLAALFRRHTGQSPMQYLTRLRQEAAQRLLRESSLSITEIAQQVGYEDPEYFGRMFRKQTGVTPREFRAETQLR